MRPHSAFTLVELLVVVALIAVLIALLLPAVQKVREAANWAGCANNLKQIGLAVHQYAANCGAVPSEGGAPSANGGPGDSASVFFNLLPYLEQNAVYRSVGGPGQSQVLAVFLCPSDATAIDDPSPVTAALGSYNYNVYVPPNPSTGVFPLAATPPTRRCLEQAMPDGSSCTILAGEHVQFCGGSGGGTGGGPGGPNPWGTTANKRVFGSTAILLDQPFIVGVHTEDCSPPPKPPPGVAWFSTAHPNALQFLLGDGSVRACSDDVDVVNGLLPALTCGAGDVWNGFDL